VLKAGLGTVPWRTAVRRFTGLPRSIFGTALAHAGLGVTLLGIVSVTSLQQENILDMKPGDTAQIAGYSLRFEGLVPVRGSNFTEDVATFALSAGQRDLGTIVASKRIYTARQMPTTEAGIRTRWLSQIYVSPGDPTAGNGMVVRIWYKPLATLIWLGAVLMMIGGTASLLDRRLRVGAPQRARRAAAAPAGAST
jgi:cytochrome c-type biogenesis protein CcmF